MSKILKKIGTALLTLCLTISCFSFTAFAAEGSLQFSDPSAAAGDTVKVTVKAIADGSAIGDVNLTVTYDTSILKFKSGTNTTGGDGTLQLSTKGDGTASEVEFSLEFTALKEGTTTLQATDYTAYLASDESLNLALGNSTVTIEGGTPVTDEGSDGENKDGEAASGGLQVQIDGKTYTVNENFSEAVIPNGFTATEMQLDGKTTKAMLQESSGQYLFYLEDSEGNSDYFLYSTDDGSFSQTQVVDVNSELSLYLMDHKDKEGLPAEYKETTTDIGGKVFTAWQNVSQKEYYLVYALSSEGTKGYYQYDTTERTYQRYTVPVVEKKESTGSLTEKVMGFLEKYLTIIMCVVWGAFLLLLIIIIVLGIKLSRRNRELDDLYDEYDLDGDTDDGQSMPRVNKKSRDQFVGYDDEDDEDYDDDFDEYEDDEYEDDSYDEYDDNDFEEYDDEYLDEEYEDNSAKKTKKKQDDDYSMDFIDI